MIVGTGGYWGMPSFWNSFLTWAVNWSRRSMIVGGMSANGGFQVDFMYSFDVWCL